MTPPPGLEVEHAVVVQAPPERVLAAFFNADDLERWWQVARSVTVPRPLGMYALEWPSSAFRDELLGQLGGAFHGTVIDYRAGSEFFVADAYWSPPAGDPIGPMALEVRCTPEGSADMTRLVVRQSGGDEGPRWQRYFEIAAAGWQHALARLKDHLDTETLGTKG